MGDTVGEIADAASQVARDLDIAKPFSGLIPFPGAGTAITVLDLIAHAVADTVTAVHASHAGGKSWLDSIIETLQHLSPTQPNSPFLSGGAGPSLGGNA